MCVLRRDQPSDLLGIFDIGAYAPGSPPARREHNRRCWITSGRCWQALRENGRCFSKPHAEAVSTLICGYLRRRANREAARPAQTRFAAGEGIYLEVLEAERADFASRRALTQAGTRQRLAVVGIYKALGGGWRRGGKTIAAARPVRS
ncbi:hypothetical protein M8494_10335 [Serratia ureilytica]